MIPERKSGKTSVASVSCGVLSIRRRFIAFDGQEHAAGGARLRNHGGFDHLHRRRPLHGAGVLPGLSGLQSLGEDDHPVGVGFARVGALGMRSRKSIIVWME